MPVTNRHSRTRVSQDLCATGEDPPVDRGQVEPPRPLAALRLRRSKDLRPVWSSALIVCLRRWRERDAHELSWIDATPGRVSHGALDTILISGISVYILP